jgi:hypothetical protein
MDPSGMNPSGHFFQISRASGLNRRQIFSSPWQDSFTEKKYDPEMIYVECQFCGKPVLWEPGKTTALLESAGIDLFMVDETCMIVADGCPACQPEETQGYTLAVVRVAGITAEEALQMLKPGGNA